MPRRKKEEKSLDDLYREERRTPEGLKRQVGSLLSTGADPETIRMMGSDYAIILDQAEKEE